MRQVRTIRYQEIAEDLRIEARRGSVRGRSAAAQRGRAVPHLRRQPGHDPQGARGAAGRGPGRRPPGVRLVRRRRARAPAAGPPRHARGAARAGSGMSSERRIGDFAFVRAPARIRQVLGRRQGAAGGPGEPGRRRAVRPRHRVLPRGARRAAVQGPGGRVVVLRPAAGRARRRGADDRGGGGRRDRRRAAGHPGRLAGAALRADHLGSRRVSPS